MSELITRRRFLSVAGLGVLGATVAACGGTQELVSATDSIVGTRDATLRADNAKVVAKRLVAERSEIRLGERSVSTWSYGGSIPGSPIRVTAGDVLRVEMENRLPAETTVHWHGIALRNDMDGVPGVTQDAIPAEGGTFIYEFAVPHPGTYFFHPHVGVQLDRGLYAPLIVDDPNEVGDYDTEWIVVIDDWTDGVGEDPDTILARLLDGGGMGGMMGMDHDGMDIGDMSYGGDVDHPLHLINGRTADSPDTLRVRTGQRVRVRLINAASDTAYRVGVPGHRVTVTHSDGFPVEPLEGDAVVLGMGERYDVTLTATEGAFPLIAEPLGKAGIAMAALTTGPAPEFTSGAGLDAAKTITLADLSGTEPSLLPDREPDIEHRLALQGDHMSYRWTINGATFADADPFLVTAASRVRLVFENQSTMFHPMHLHGHTFAVSASGVRKDTAIVLPGETLSVDFDADNPGAWALHCHNIYHAEAGMMSVLGYRA